MGGACGLRSRPSGSYHYGTGKPLHSVCRDGINANSADNSADINAADVDTDADIYTYTYADANDYADTHTNTNYGR